MGLLSNFTTAHPYQNNLTDSSGLVENCYIHKVKKMFFKSDPIDSTYVSMDVWLALLVSEDAIPFVAKPGLPVCFPIINLNPIGSSTKWLAWLR